MIHPWWKAIVFAVAASAAVGLGGCGMGVSTPTALQPARPHWRVPAPTARGIVMGGQQPVAGVTLQLYQSRYDWVWLGSDSARPRGANKRRWKLQPAQL